MNRRPHFVLFGTPVRVEPMFFLVAVYLGLGDDLGLVAAWVGVMFVGILVHEFGHALAYRAYGQDASIVLWGLGGLTYGSKSLPPRSSIVVSFAGPCAGLFVLGLPALAVQRSASGLDPFVSDVLDMVVWVNVAWSVVNLLPILPLDGGNITSNAISLVTHRPGERPTRYLSVGVCAAAALWALSVEWTFGAMFALIFGIMNVAALRKPASAGFVQVQKPPSRRALRQRERMGTSVDGQVRLSAQQLVALGEEALDRGDLRTAVDAASGALVDDPYPDVARQATELQAWAYLVGRRPVDAAAALQQLPPGRKANRYLRAALGAAGDGDVTALVEAFLFAGQGSDRVRAALFVADCGLVDPVAHGLAAAGPDGQIQLVSIGELLRERNRTEAAARFADAA